MFDFSSSGSDDVARTKTITIAYADASCLDLDKVSESYSGTETPSGSSSSLLTPSSEASGRTLLDRLERDRETETYFGYHPIWRDMSLTDGIKLQTLEYLWESKVFQLFNFLMTHLLAHTPDDPVPFLADLVDRCIRYRDDDGDPPLVFQDDHVRSVYSALDPLGEGSVSYSQYLAGMQTLGLTEFNILPDGVDDRQNVPKEVFVQEATSALVKQLNLILGKGKVSAGSDALENVVDYESCTLTTKSKLVN